MASKSNGINMFSHSAEISPFLGSRYYYHQDFLASGGRDEKQGWSPGSLGAVVGNWWIIDYRYQVPTSSFEIKPFWSASKILEIVTHILEIVTYNGNCHAQFRVFFDLKICRNFISAEFPPKTVNTRRNSFPKVKIYNFFFYWLLNVSFSMLGLKETDLLDNIINIYQFLSTPTRRNYF